LSAGGYIAYYPTKVPFHYMSKFIKQGEDPYGYLAEECRKPGMAVTARLDTHIIRKLMRRIGNDITCRQQKESRLPEFVVFLYPLTKSNQ